MDAVLDRGIFRKNPSLLTAFILALGIIGAFTISALLLYATGTNPWGAYAQLIEGAFGSVHGISETLVKTTPLLFIGLAIAIAFKGKFWNIGAEGQLVIGAIAATWIGLSLTGLSPILLIPLAMLAGFVGGAIWGVIPGFLKAKFRVNEIIVTLLMNYIALFFLSYLVRGPLKDPLAYGYPLSPLLPEGVMLPKLVPGTRLHIGILIAIAFAVLVYILLRKTVLGYRIRAVGTQAGVARYGGINVFKTILLTMILSGGIAGVAGTVEIYGIHGRILDGISAGYGYIGIVVALLGRLRPSGVCIAAFFFGALFVGADMMRRALEIPFALIYVIEGIVMFLLVASEFLIRRRR